MLEIGAGTEEVTLSVLEQLGEVLNQVPRLQDYVFTNIFNKFFKNVQEKLMA